MTMMWVRVTERSSCFEAYAFVLCNLTIVLTSDCCINTPCNNVNVILEDCCWCQSHLSTYLFIPQMSIYTVHPLMLPTRRFLVFCVRSNQ